MSCKCDTKASFNSQDKRICFLSEVDELRSKIKKTLGKLGLEFLEQQGIVCIEVDNVEIFFRENIDALETFFNVLERETIKVLTCKDMIQLDFTSILKAKNLQHFINLINDKDFFDVINNESLTTHFQPIIDIEKRKVFGYEALARGVYKDATLMYPDKLFAKSKRNDMTFMLDRLCRESALKTAATKKINQKVFINFIPTSIYDPEFCLRSTIKWANQLEFDPSQIVFEVVETEQVGDKTHLVNILQFYRDQGFSIALDDVGEGYSGLNMLIDIKPDIIKIDRNIITNIDKDKLKQSTYKALYHLCKENEITVLAEGVETPYEFETIKEIGVDLVQGYLFAKPSAEPLRKYNCPK